MNGRPDLETDLRETLTAAEKAAPAPDDLTQRLLAGAVGRDRVGSPASRRRHGWPLPVLAAVIAAVVTIGNAVALLADRSGRTRPAESQSPRPTVSSSSPRPTSRPSPTVAAGTHLAPWHATTVGGAAASGIPMIGTRTSLYVNDRTTSRILRVDPATGAVLASRAVNLSLVTNAVIVDHTLWVTPDNRADGSSTVLGLDLDSLAVVAVLGGVGAASDGEPALAGSSDNDRLYIGRARTVTVIDTTSRHVVASYRAPGHDIDSLAVSPHGSRLYVAYGNPHSSTSAEAEAELDPETGAVIGSPFRPNSGGGVFDLVASSGGVWLGTGSGMNAYYEFDADDGGVGPTGGFQVEGGGGYPVTATATPSVVWLGGTGTFACVDPLSGATRAGAHTKETRNGDANVAYFRPAGSRLFAFYQGSEGQQLVRLTPPAACTP